VVLQETFDFLYKHANQYFRIAFLAFVWLRPIKAETEVTFGLSWWLIIQFVLVSHDQLPKYF